MLLYPNAKINIGLNIVSKRTDGFHNLETIFYPIALSDILEFTKNLTINNTNSLPFNISGISIDCNNTDNLCIKAYRLLQKDFSIPSINIHLHKIIPLGAGLGGGSSDAAFILKGLNNYFNLQLTSIQLKKYASEIGSDCSFFIDNKASFATEKGNILQGIQLNLSTFYIVLIKPSIHISTKEAYSGIIPKKPSKSLQELIQLPIEKWKNTIKNDFEDSIFIKYPEIKKIKDQLYQLGAVYSSMSGSGSSVYGIFENKSDLSTYFPNCFYWQEKMI